MVDPVVLAQLDPTRGGPVALLGTFLLTAGAYALTAHIAARYVLGDVSPKLAVPIGVALALVAFLLQRRVPAVVLPLSVAVDFVLIRSLYRTGYKLTALITVVHYTVFVLLGVTLFNLVTLLGTAPG